MAIQEKNKKINLVYDNWNKTTPKHNLVAFLGSGSFRDERYFFEFYERFFFEQLGYEKSLPCKRYRIEDVYSNTEKTFFYGLKTSLSLEEIFCVRNATFSKQLLKCLKECDNIKVLFIREHESETFSDFKCLVNFLNKNGISENKFVILSNNPKSKEYRDKLNSNIEIHKLNLLSLTSSSVFNELGSNFVANKKGKFFVCHNKSPKPHRIATLSFLKANNILEDTNWSMITPLRTSEEDFKRYFSESDYELYYSSIKDILESKPKYSDNENETMVDDNGDFKRDDFPHLEGAGGASGGMMIREEHETHQNSYVSIITESMFDDVFDTIHITEKSLRPFYFYQIPIIVSSYNHIKYMEQEFGLDFYRDVVDHSYDEEPNQVIRLKKIADEVKRLYQNKNQIIEFYKQNQDRFEKNKQIIANLPNNDSDYKFFKTFLS